MDDHEKLARAKAKVQAMSGFYIHLAVFVAVLAILIAINVLSGSGWWVQWVLLGWGALVAGHYTAVFTDLGGGIRDWQARKTRELADKM